MRARSASVVATSWMAALSLAALALGACSDATANDGHGSVDGGASSADSGGPTPPLSQPQHGVATFYAADGSGACSFDASPSDLDVAAIGQARVHKYGVEDGALLMARSRAGAMVQMHVAYNCPETLPRRRLEVVGTAGQVIARDTMGQTPGGTLEFIDAATGVTQPVPVSGADRSPFLNQAEAFADAVLGGAPFAFPPARDLHIMDLVLRAQAQAKPPQAKPPTQA